MKRNISTCHEMMAAIEELGFVPLLDGGIAGFSAEEMAVTWQLLMAGTGHCGNGKGP